METKKNRSIRFWTACLGLLLTLFTGSASATIYVRDPVPTGTTGYTAGALTAQNPTTNAIIGCSGAWTGTTGTLLAKLTNLQYPPSVNYTSRGGSFGITHTDLSATTGRSTSRLISGTSLPNSGTLYYSTLINVDATAMSRLANGQAYYFGVSRTDYRATDSTAVTFPATGVHVGFKKVSGVVTLSLSVNGTSYPIIASATAGQTYFCVVEIQLNAGTGGKEIVTAIVDPTGPNMIGTYTASTSAADVVAAGTTFTYLNFGGLYATGTGSVYFDEFLMANSNYEACPIDLGNLSLLSTTATAIGNFSATANASLTSIGTTDPTVYLDWGTSANALNTTTNLGTFTEVGTLSTVLTNLLPTTTYYYRHRADDGSNVATSLVTTAFTTTGAASFSGVTASNILTTAYMSGVLSEPSVAATTASLWFGSSAGGLSLAKTWAPVTASTPFAWSIPDCSLGATYYYAFKAEFDYGGNTYTFWSSTNSLLMSADVIWTGAGSDTAWTTGGNWNLGFAPLAVSTATIGQGASVTATANGVANLLQVNASTPVSINFTGHSLTVPTVHVGTKTTSSLTLKGSFAVNTLFRIGDASASGSTVVLADGAALNVGALQVGYSSANNVLRVLNGASVTASAEALVLTSGTKCNNTFYVGTGGVFTAQAGIRVDNNVNWFIIDGGTVTNSGGYYNGLRKSNETGVGATLDIINGGFMKQVGTLRGSPWYQDRVRVMNGGVLQAGAITIGTDGDSGSGGRLIVSNATVTGSSLAVPSDDRHQGEGVMIYEAAGRTTTVTISGGMNLGVYNSTRAGAINRNNFLNLYGGSISVGGAFTMGNTVVAAHSNNVIRVLGGNAAFSAGSFIACNNSRIEYTIPAESFDTPPILVSGTATLDPTTTFKVDATAFVQGGMVTLLSAGTLTSTMPDERVFVTVKSGYTSMVFQEDNAVKVRIAPSATMTIIR